MPKFAALAVALENGLAMNLRTSPRFAKKQAAKQAAVIKPVNMATSERLKINEARKTVQETPRKTKLTLRFATLSKTKNKAP